MYLLSSTLLKSDQWLRRQTVEDSIRGAINFRSIPNSNIYALGQPTVEAVDDVISKIKHTHGSAPRIVWITLREEPVVYINGAPYCLRREGFSLRNMKGKSYLNIRVNTFFKLPLQIMGVFLHLGLRFSRNALKMMSLPSLRHLVAGRCRNSNIFEHSSNLALGSSYTQRRLTELSSQSGKKLYLKTSLFSKT